MKTITEFYQENNFKFESITGIVNRYIKKFNIPYTPKGFKILFEQLKPVFNRELPTPEKGVDFGKMGFLTEGV